ncbi:MAG: glycosyltransferase family 4 protein [Puniceicoccaceae bacterium]
MRIVIVNTHVPFVEGGAETLARTFQKALQAKNHEVELVRIPFKWYPPERIHEHVLACRLLDLTEVNGVPIDRVIGLKFPTYHVRHPNKVTFLVHQHRTAYEMWDGEHCDISHYPNGKAIRDSIESIDRALLPEAKRIYAMSKTVASRLETYCGLPSTLLYHPPENATVFRSGPFGDYLYFPSRLTPVKRQQLAMEALALTRQPVNIRFSGSPDNPRHLNELKELARKLKVEKRVQFLGRIPFEEMVELYAGCRGVLFIPHMEDYGYITLEGMLSSKPVITCADSGGPTEFIRNEEEGLVTDSDPRELAKAMDALWSSTAFAREAGLRARKRYEDLDITWDHVAECLVK